MMASLTRAPAPITTPAPTYTLGPNWQGNNTHGRRNYTGMFKTLIMYKISSYMTLIGVYEMHGWMHPD